MTPRVVACGRSPSRRHTTGTRVAAFFLALGVAACAPPDPGPPAAAERRAIADTVLGRMEAAYDFSNVGPDDDVVARLMSLYPDSGRIVSAAAGQVTTSRDTIEAQVRSFWERVGVNMQRPRWVWGRRHVDVLSSSAAVVTATYAIEHHTPRGRPHTIAGAWTALFQKQDGRWVIVQEHLSDRPAVPSTPSSSGGADSAAGDHAH